MHEYTTNVKNNLIFNRNRCSIDTYVKIKKEDYDDKKTNDLIEIIADLNYKLNTPQYLDNNLSFVNIENIIKLFDEIIDILNKYIVVDENTINENINNSLKKTIFQITHNLIIKIQGLTDTDDDIELLEDIKTKLNNNENIWENINNYILPIDKILEKRNYIVDINNNIQNNKQNKPTVINVIERLLNETKIKILKLIKKVTFDSQKNQIKNIYMIPLSRAEKKNMYDLEAHYENNASAKDDLSEKTLANTKANTSQKIPIQILNKKTPEINGGKKTRRKRTLKPKKMRIKNKTKKARIAKRK